MWRGPLSSALSIVPNLSYRLGRDQSLTPVAATHNERRRTLKKSQRGKSRTVGPLGLSQGVPLRRERAHTCLIETGGALRGVPVASRR
jgi:hypothetical protein